MDSGTSPQLIHHALTVDVEDYFQVEAFTRDVPRHRWEQCPIRVDDNTYRILDLFDQYEVKATFFVLGWVAWKSPRLVQEIVRRGHEVACHSYWHRLVYQLDPKEFRRDTRLATRIIEDAAQVRPLGYRAPTYSITRQSLWALRILAEEGYAYDSSIFPVRHDTYGYPDFPRFPVQIRWPDLDLASSTTGAPKFIEYPPCTVRCLGANLPGPGGGYLRILPLRYALWTLDRLERREGRSGTLYLHPWEIDPEQPRIGGSVKSRLRHYYNLHKTSERLAALLKRFRFAPMRSVLEQSPPRESWAVPPQRDDQEPPTTLVPADEKSGYNTEHVLVGTAR